MPSVRAGTAASGQGRVDPSRRLVAVMGPVDICRALGRIVVTPRGALTRASARSLRTILEDLIDGQGNLTIIVDAMFITSVDPHAARVFADAALRMCDHGGVFTVTSANDGVRAALEAAGIPLGPAI